MPAKPEILRALEGLSDAFLVKEVKKFIDSLKESNGKRHATSRNAEAASQKSKSPPSRTGPAGRSKKDFQDENTMPFV